jgi:hypothetical protein
MSGLLLKGSGAGFAGVTNTSAPSYGAAKSYVSGAASGSTAAFGGPSSTATPTASQLLHPSSGFGLAFWVGCAAIAGLAFLRYSLPN